MRILAAVCLSVALSISHTGCGTRSPIACPEAVSVSRVATVYYATDRRETNVAGRRWFGGDRTDPPGLHLGKERVVLGPRHRLGKLDAAIAIIPDGGPAIHPRTARENALRRTDAEIQAFAKTRLRAAIRASAPAQPGGRRQVLLYVHGFNNSFDEAIRKTAQLAGDLGLVNCQGQPHGVAIAYSWPTLGGVLSYIADEENAEWTEQRLAPFLQSVAGVCRAENAELYVIAHSMGARAVVRSLADLARDPAVSGKRPVVDHVVLLAPDIGKGIFEQYVERFLPHVGHMTIYVSARDRALAFSSFLHGGRQRLGLFGSTIVAAVELTGLRLDDHRYLAGVAGQAGEAGKIDMIDVSTGFASQFGHSYEDAAFIQDLRYLINHDAPAGSGSRANLKPKVLSSRVFQGTAARRLNYFTLGD